MLESFPLLIFLSIVGNVVSLGNGPGVCSRTERQTVERVVTKEVYVGTTEIPCVVNSWLDELSCMNRKTKTINVTEHRNETIQEIVPMVIKFCCAGYTLEGDRCVLQTTTTTTTERMTTTSTVRVVTTQQQKTTIPTTKPQTTIKPTTQLQTTIKPTTKPQTTIKPTTQPQTTIKPTTQPQTTIKPTTQPQTTIKPTIIKPEITTIKKSETTVPPKSTKSVLTTSETTTNDIAATSERKLTTGAKVIPKRITTDIVGGNTRIPDDKNKINPDSSSDSVDTRDMLLYVSAACGLLSFITMIVVVGICYQRSKRNNNRRFHNDILSMETVRVNGLNQMHGVENPNYKQQNDSECVEPINYRERKQNCNNVYTEMRLTGANQYDDLVGIEEDPYDELPDELPGDYQDCDASPRLYKASVSPENPYDVSKY